MLAAALEALRQRRKSRRRKRCYHDWPETVSGGEGYFDSHRNAGYRPDLRSFPRQTPSRQASHLTQIATSTAAIRNVRFTSTRDVALCLKCALADIRQRRCKRVNRP